MGIGQCFIMAFKSLSTSKMRSFLTMLGIIIGVAAVIIIMALGNGMTVYMNDTFQSLGATNITVNIMGRGSSRSVSVDDIYEVFEQNNDKFSYMSPTVNVSAQIKDLKGEIHYPTMTGVGEMYLDMKGYDLSDGRNIGFVDIEFNSKVCVVGAYYDYMLFSGNSVGNYLNINGEKYLIVGSVAEIDDKTQEYGADDFVLLPYSTASRYISRNSSISNFTFVAKSEDVVKSGISTIENRLYETFKNEDNYMVSSLTELLNEMNSMMNIVVLILAAIAGISLLVGGIGIMNIMLVSVTERTREIGIRKALGAKNRHIKMQFVIEAATTSGLGGILGILAGIGISTAVSGLLKASMDMQAIPTATSVLVSFGISFIIGIIFGYLPANKAAKLNPIEALRHD